MNLRSINLIGIYVYLALAFLLLKLLVAPNINFEGETNYISLACDFFILMICIISINAVHAKFSFIYYCFLIVLATYTLSTYIYFNDFFGAARSLLRIFTPFFLIALLCSYFSVKPNEIKNLSFFIILYVLGLSLIGIIYLPPSINRTDGINSGLWWPAYFTNLHTTTYVATSLFFISFALWYKKWVSSYSITIFFTIIFYSVIYGWGVRTAAISLLAVLIFYIYFEMLSKNIIYSSLVFFSVISLVSVYLVFFFDWIYINSLSSGRLLMFEFKYNQLISNSWIAWIIGNGAGSDLVETSFWWWGAKDSHNDILSILVEGGLVYLIVFFVLIYKLIKILSDPLSKSIIFSILIAGMLSNGFLARPLALYLALFALVIIYCPSEK